MDSSLAAKLAAVHQAVAADSVDGFEEI